MLELVALFLTPFYAKINSFSLPQYHHREPSLGTLVFREGCYNHEVVLYLNFISNHHKNNKMVREVPSDLLWTLVRNNSSFIKKQKELPVMTSEPQNLTGLNSFKYSGLANKKSAGVSVKKSGEKKELVTLSMFVKKGSASLNTAIAKNPKKGSAMVEKLLTKNGYRRDLIGAATKKYSAILKSFKSAKKQVMNPRTAARKAKEAAAKKAASGVDEEAD
ncbi:unnamed protein product [Amoebophrya sp. A120]|nr:unnamed protein product [Amoebophrya sp. A120]|eukprot:GSA120T00001246001.1